MAWNYLMLFTFVLNYLIFPTLQICSCAGEYSSDTKYFKLFSPLQGDNNLKTNAVSIVNNTRSLRLEVPF